MLQIPVNIYCATRLTIEQYDIATGRTVSGGSASGFTLYNEITSTNYLITNRHVVEPRFRGEVGKATGSVSIRGYYQPNDPTKEPELFAGKVREPRFDFHPDATVDLAIVSGDVDWEAGDTISPGLGTISRLHFSMLPTVGELRYLSAGEAVAMPGYPQIAGEVGSRPVLVSGMVASDPRFPAEVGGQVLPNSVLCHSFSWGGMSGAPVIAHPDAVGETKLVGVNAGHIHMQGVTGGVLSHFVPAQRVLELLASVGDDEASALLTT